MSRFLRNLARSGITVHQQRYSGRGRVTFGGMKLRTAMPGLSLPSSPLTRGDVFGGARFRAGLEGGIKVATRFPLQRFVNAAANKERKVLFASGRYALRTYRTQLRRKPPAKYTRGGKSKRPRISKRYRDEVLDKKTRPPYFRTGILYRSTEFVVNLQKGSFTAGPPLITGLNRRTKSSLPVPALLDRGGPALMKVARKRGTAATWKKVRYRAFPYRKVVFDKTKPFFLKKIAEVPFK